MFTPPTTATHTWYLVLTRLSHSVLELPGVTSSHDLGDKRSNFWISSQISCLQQQCTSDDKTNIETSPSRRGAQQKTAAYCCMYDMYNAKKRLQEKIQPTPSLPLPRPTQGFRFVATGKTNRLLIALHVSFPNRSGEAGLNGRYTLRSCCCGCCCCCGCGCFGGGGVFVELLKLAALSTRSTAWDTWRRQGGGGQHVSHLRNQAVSS